MIVKQLIAENLLKYSRLELKDLPEQALIGVSGPNESGKTAIAETVCFALFGRTFSYNPEQFTKAIKWGQPAGSANLTFIGRDGRSYVVTRYVDTDGNHNARLSLLDSESALATGVADVNNRVIEACGFDYKEYIDSFYLAQREISMPHAQSGMVKDLLGIEDLDIVSDALKREVELNREAISDLQEQLASAQARLDELAIQPEALAEFEHSREEAEQRLETARETIGQLNAVAREMEEAASAMERNLDVVTSMDSDATLDDWDTLADQTIQAVDRLRDACSGPINVDPCPEDELRGWVEELAGRVDGFDALYQRAVDYRDESRQWLQGVDEEDSGEDSEENEAQKTGQGDDYPAMRKDLDARLRQIPSSRRRTRLLGFVFLALSLLIGGGCWVQQNAPGSQAGQWVDGLMQRHMPQLPQERCQIIAYTASVLFGFSFLITVVRSGRLSRRLRETRGEANLLERKAAELEQDIALFDDLKQLPLTALVETLKKLHNQDLVKDVGEYADGDGKPLLEDEARGEFMARMEQCRATFRSDMEELREVLASQLQTAQDGEQEQQAEVSRLDAVIEEETARRAEAEQLRQRMDELHIRIQEPEDRIRVRNAAEELIQGANRRIYSHFNRQMRDYLVNIIPLFTEQRYQHLKIDDEFKVQVFSTDKSDFVQLEELSSGTQRQITLAVRLALSQALVDANEHGRQTLILDEPFAFFDRERIRQSLDTLPKVSEDISQIWIISQEFSEDSRFDVRIECSREVDTLRVDCTGTG